MADNPITRKEKYLAKLTGSYTGNVPDPITRVEKYLYDLCQKGISGLTPEEIENAVNKYLKENPVQPGATEEQAQQIEQNKTDIASLKTETGSLKEDLSTKITKFYASSQGETHLADSDNGKITDMVLYGRSEQKQYSGKNLLNPTLQTTIKNGVTCTANGDGTYTLNGTTTTTTVFDIAQDVSYSSFRLAGCPVGGAHDVSYELQARTDNLIYGYDTGDGKNIKANENFFIRIRINTGINCNNLLFKPMIVDASLYPDATYDDFEPYVGGQPSPSPDYPQEIKSVVNPTVKVCGENLYPGSDLIGLTKTYTTDFIPVILHKGKIYFHFDTSSDTSDGRYHINAKYFDINKELMGGNGKESIAGNNISHVSFEFDGTKAGINHETIDLKNVSYVKIMFGIYATTATKITYKNIMISATDSDFEPYKPIQTVTLPYTLNAIPVESGGNVTIDGQQYIADYVDVERGKLVRCVKKLFLKQYQWSKAINKGVLRFYASTIDAVGIDGNKVIKNAFSISSHFTFVTSTPDRIGTFITNADGTNANIGFAFSTDATTSSDDFNNWILNNKPFVFLPVLKEELPLTSEQTQAFKSLATYYPITNISINSEQLDGYTVLNYPISMENGWNYVKQQIGDTRDYIYDMDIQSAEAYVNSEYAVALTELEV